jgi:hypothetical protein
MRPNNATRETIYFAEPRIDDQAAAILREGMAKIAKYCSRVLG